MGLQRKRGADSSGTQSLNAKQTSRPTDDVCPSWDTQASGSTIVRLQNGQGVIFTGAAVLQVLRGTVTIAGNIVSAGAPTLKLANGGRGALGILIEATALVSKIPLAATQITELTLTALPAPPSLLPYQHTAAAAAAAPPTPPPPPKRPPALSEDDEGEDDECVDDDDDHDGPFTLCLPGSAEAPAVTGVDEQWEQAIGAVVQAAAAAAHRSSAPPSPSLVVAVCGSKGTGKSTLCRLLVNHLLNVVPAVAYLDTDLGQSEFSPPGLVALHLLTEPLVGPPHVHPRPAPLRAHFIGDNAPQVDPERYVSAIQSLYSWYVEQYSSGDTASHPPLVVNTQGWIRGLGFDLLVEVLAHMNPTHVLQVRAGPEHKNLPPAPFWYDLSHGAPCRTHMALLDSIVAGGLSGRGAEQTYQQGIPGGQDDMLRDRDEAPASLPTARVLKPEASRTLQWVAWAKQLVGWDPAWGRWDTDDVTSVATALTAALPYEVPLGILAVQFLYNSVPAAELGWAINGAVVGLTAAAAGEAERQIASRTADGAVEHPAVAPSLAPCLGLGLVRAVDMKRRVVYILSAVPEAELHRVVALQVGRLELPPSLLQDGERASPYLALFTLSAEAAGAGALRNSRKNIVRSSLVERMG